MKVIIINCSNPGYWYAGFVGQTFNVETSSHLDTDNILKYTVVPSPGTDPLYYINVADCVSVDTISNC